MAELKKFLYDDKLWPYAVVAETTGQTDGCGLSDSEAARQAASAMKNHESTSSNGLSHCDQCPIDHSGQNRSKLETSFKDVSHRNLEASTGSSSIFSNCSCLCHKVVCDKLLIFTTGTLTYTPHEVGFKLIQGKDMLKPLNAEVMPPERLQEVNEMLRRTRESRERAAAAAQADQSIEEVDGVMVEEEEPPPPPQFDMSRFDQPDHKIDLQGHIVGMTLSQDQKRLFVNLREWPPGSAISDPLVPPPIAQQMEICVIDLEHLCLLSRRYYGHRGYTPNDDCFFIFMSVNQQYIASGSEDKKGYVWDQTYGCLLASLPHDNVVNCLAFNPADPEMLVSVSDDQTVNIWRSKRQMQRLNMADCSF